VIALRIFPQYYRVECFESTSEGVYPSVIAHFDNFKEAEAAAKKWIIERIESDEIEEFETVEISDETGSRLVGFRAESDDDIKVVEY